MIKLPAGVELQGLSRVAAYAAIAALVAGALVAADSLYRADDQAPVQAASPSTGEQSAEIADPSSVNAATASPRNDPAPPALNAQIEKGTAPQTAVTADPARSPN